jgi:hypothetical protein
MYVASKAEQDWLLNEQRKLYTRSWEDPRYTFRKLWGLVTDLRNLRCALMRVSRNKGSRTAGVDRVTVRQVLVEGSDDTSDFVETSMESPVHNERCTPGSEEWIPETAK